MAKKVKEKKAKKENKGSKKHVLRDITDALSEKHGWSKGRVYEAAQAICDEARDTIVGMKPGDKLFLHGLGMFEKVHLGERERRNPMTGKTVTVGPNDTIRFKVASNLRKL